MEGAELRAWQRRLRFTDREAAAAVRLSVSAYRKQRRGERRVSGQTARLAEFVEIFDPAWLDIAECAMKLARCTTPRR